MSTTKFTTTDPEELVSKVDPSTVNSLLARGEGNTFILDSINSLNNVSKEDPTEGLSPQAKVGSAKADEVLVSAKQLKAAGVGSEAFEVINFSELARQNALGSQEESMLAMGNSLNAIGDTGDVSAVGKVSDGLTDLGFNAPTIFATVAPALVPSLLSNFNLDTLMPNLTPDLKELFGDEFNRIIDSITTSWYWLDEELELYDYKVLSQLSPWAIKFLAFNPKYKEVVKLSGALYGYRNNIVK